MVTSIRLSIQASAKDFSDSFVRNEIELVKLEGDPDSPDYELRDTRNPRIYPTVRLPGDTYLNLHRVRAKVFHACGIIPFPGLNQEKWLTTIARKADRGEVEIVEGPDMSLSFQILEAVESSITSRGRGSEFSDLMAGCFIEREYAGRRYWWLWPYRLVRGIVAHGRDVDPRFRLGFPVKRSTIWQALRQVGVVSLSQRFGNKVTRCWGIDVEKLYKILGIEEKPVD